jgi:hypothetical protein
MKVDGHMLNEAVKLVGTVVTSDEMAIPYSNEFYREQDQDTARLRIQGLIERHKRFVRQHSRLQSALAYYNTCSTTYVEHNSQVIPLMEAIKLRNGLEKRCRNVLQDLQKSTYPDRRYRYSEGPNRIKEGELVAQHAIPHDGVIRMISVVDREIGELRSKIGRVNNIEVDIDWLEESDLVVPEEL